MAEGLGQVISWYICTVAAIIFLTLRLWIRIRRFNSVGVEDGLLILSACCLTGDLIIQQHMWNLGMAEITKASRQEFVQIMQMIIPGSILYVTSLWAIKLALVLLYKKVAAPTSRLQIVYSIAIVLLLVSWTAIFFDIIFQCYPHDKRWSEDPNYQCDPRNAEINYWLTVLLNIGSDLVTISLPIAMVLKLQMRMKQKLGVAAIFALGFFVVIASIIRAYYSKRNETMLTCTVSMIETSVAIITASLPALRSLILGHVSTVNSESNYGHYELSSAGINRTRRTQSRITTVVVGGTRNDSDEELFKGGGRLSASRRSPLTPTVDSPGVISVSTTFQMHHGVNDESPDSKEAVSPYA